MDADDVKAALKVIDQYFDDDYDPDIVFGEGEEPHLEFVKAAKELAAWVKQHHEPK